MSNATADKLLDAAERFTQTRGFNGFSYRDLEKEVGIKTASIHYHFPSKSDLAFHMADRYVSTFSQSLTLIDQKHQLPWDRLRALGELFVAVVRDQRFCACLMLTTDRAVLPETAMQRVNDFFNLTEKWIQRTLKEAQQTGVIRSDLAPKAVAAQFLALLEGGMLVAHARSNPKHLQSLVQHAMASWKP